MKSKAFKSIIGYMEVKDELIRILDQMNNSENYAVLGVAEPHGLLLHGVPGVGKSTFAMDFLKASGRNTYICRKDKTNGDFIEQIVEVFNIAAEMDHYYAKTKQLIVENKEKLERLTAYLIQEKTLLGDQVQKILNCA